MSHLCLSTLPRRLALPALLLLGGLLSACRGDLCCSTCEPPDPCAPCKPACAPAPAPAPVVAPAPAPQAPQPTGAPAAP